MQLSPGRVVKYEPMKASLEKLKKFFQLEAERGYDNHAVLGGLERMLQHWEPEAIADGLPDDFIKLVSSRILDYARLSEQSRAETLQGLIRRIENLETQEKEETPSQEFSRSEESKAQEKAPLYTHKIQPEPGSPQPPLTQAPSTAPQVKADQLEPEGLEADVTILQGVGPRNSQNLEKLGIRKIRDLLFHYPRKYIDYAQLSPINRLIYGEEVTVIGTVERISVREMRGGKMKATEALISDGSGVLRVTWFNNPWLVKRLPKGTYVSLSGKVDQYLGRPVMNSPEWETLDAKQLNTNRIVPVYPLTSNMTQKWLRRLVHQVVSYWAPQMPDPLPDNLVKKAALIPYGRALEQVHFPDSWDDLKKARERLAFDEIFYLQIGVQQQKRHWQQRTARVFDVTDEWMERHISSLPYPLTEAQKQAVQDVRKDLASGYPMNRLLQGDVGSGKTTIAATAIAIVTSHNAQSAVLAPTSILAEQHYQSFQKLLCAPPQPVTNIPAQQTRPSLFPLQASEIALLLGATPESEKKEIRAGIEDGSIKLVIGTHALLEEPINFKDLQLAIIDEQHRFGVEQRARLRAKGESPHLLVMTATPIPRSLALTLYGDLDLTVMDELPPGRIPVETYVLYPKERERAYALIHRHVEQGYQAFIIYPLIEESENSDAKSAVAEYERLQKEVFPDLNIGLLHGKMKPAEKENVMKNFRDGNYHILVATTVVEVGVDIPNATVMLIESANRFGLAQLHQLRGRVGRGAEKAYCLLIPETPSDIENERLQAMSETNDGFILAEKDLQQRGPGEFLGTRQSGFSDLRMASLTDVQLIEQARRFAIELFESDPDLEGKENRLLRQAVERAWGGMQSDIS